MSKNSTITIIICLLIAEGCFIDKPIQHYSFNGLQRDSLKLSQEKINYIPTAASYEIKFMIFDEFNDTMRIYINDRIAWQGYVNEANNPSTSSGYSGITVNLDSKKEIKKVSIVLLEQKKFVEFTIAKYYPLYTLQRFNDIWYINGRGAPPTLK
jgi:hypothetical protein